jgi:tetratricopeptide (TPR) repeat protein
MSTVYRDFELEISSNSPMEYFGKVLNSPGGQSERCRLKFKFITKDPKDLELLRLKIENAVLRGDDDTGRRGPTTQSEKVLRDFGRELFRGIFVDAEPIRDAYARSKGALSGSGQGRLRMKLHIDSPELASLPWEYLCDETETPNYIGLRLPVVRTLDMPGVAAQMQVKGPLRILGMIANPGTPEWPRLDEPAERRRIAEGIDKLQRDGRVIFEWVPGGTGTDLLSKLMENEWHIFHFIGHGGIEEHSDSSSDDGRTEDAGFIVLVDEYGQPVKKFSSELATLLDTSQNSLRLAVLNCCESAKMDVRGGFGSPAAALIRSGLPAVVAMQFPFRDKSAIRLAEGFYMSLANNHPVDSAVTMARKFIREDSNIEWGIPVLYMRATDGRIFEVDNPAAGPVPVDSKAAGIAPANPPSAMPANQVAPVAEEKLPEFKRLIDVDQSSAGDLERAARLGRELVDERKGDRQLVMQVARAYYDLGRMQLVQNDVPKAAASLAYAIELDPSQSEYRIRRGNLYARVGFYELALADIAEAIRLCPDNAEYHWIKGIVYDMVAGSGGNPSVLKEAINAFGAAIQLNAREPKYLVSRASALTRAERPAEGLADIDRAISIAPDDADLLSQRATVVKRVASAA